MQNKGLFQGGTSQCLWAEVFGLPAISCLACCTYLGKTLRAQAFLGLLQVLLGSHPSHQDRTAGTLQVRAVNFVLSVPLFQKNILSLDGGRQLMFPK